MRRAVQQAKQEAAAGADQASYPADKERPADSQTAQDHSAAHGKKALTAVLRKAAAKMQEEEAEAAAAKPAQEELTGTHALPDLSSDQLDQQYEGVDPEQLQLSGLVRQQSGSSSGLDSTTVLNKTQSLGNRLGSLLKNAFSPSRQSSYVPLDADSSPEAQEADDSREQEPLGTGRRALPRDASLGQRLGSVLTGGLSVSRQSSYTSLSGDDGVVPSEAKDEDADESGKQATLSAGHRALPRDASLSQRLGSLLKGALSSPGQASYTSVNDDDDVDSRESSGRGVRSNVASFKQQSRLHDVNSSERVLPRELSLRERYGSRTLSRDPSYSLLASDNLAGPAAEHESSMPVSPGRRRALPRDASYLPEWVTRSHGQTPRGDGNGNASPRCRLGTSFSTASTASDPDVDAPMPTWVDWPQATPRGGPQPTRQQAEEEAAQSDSEAAVPILMAPPHLRRQQQDSQRAASALPRAKRPLAFAPDPLSLSLVHTPSMNPQLDLSPIVPVATPKGQRLFDFWHQKMEQKAPAATTDAQALGSAPAVAPATGSEVYFGAATHAGQPGNAEQVSPSTAQPVESAALGAAAALLDAAGTAELTHLPASSGAAPQLPQLPQLQPHQSQQHDLPAAAASSVHGLTAAAAGMPSLDADGSVTVQPGTVSAAFVAELQSATRLVHQQSLQQEALLEGIEHALSQLSEQRLLVQNAQAAAVTSSDQGVLSGEWRLLVQHEVNSACARPMSLHNTCMCCSHVLTSRLVSLLRMPACILLYKTCCKEQSFLANWSSSTSPVATTSAEVSSSNEQW